MEVVINIVSGKEHGHMEKFYLLVTVYENVTGELGEVKGELN